MKRTATMLFVLTAACCLAFAVPALAVGLMSESFPYGNGDLVAVAGGNWANHSGVGTDIQVTGGVAVGSMTAAPDDNRAFAAQGATAKTYACFTVNIPTPAAAPVLNYFAHFKDTGTINFPARVYVAPSGATFTFGLSVGSCALNGTPSCSPTLWPVSLSYDTDYTVAISYDAALGSAELWVNPVTEASAKIIHNTWSGTTPQTGFLVSAFALRQSNTPPGGVPGTPSWTFKVDNIGVGTSFSDGCTNGPTPTHGITWGRVKTIYR